ncbi:hypothetical protein [Aliiroseovarius lamellibrachiae]|uniref:hypothetical protein n=1 Tax=Aliiroseovarius lamellibrachiae TaxID=1924933 RepID=UPI001BE00054|nr:hypothetical protein [Aliiroseovarius lamellibrachiae]MBT2131561.1 hypothetical protein [Aliiroseovarius lamellibrachiae]
MENKPKFQISRRVGVSIALLSYALVCLVIVWWVSPFFSAFSRSELSFVRFALHEWPFQKETFVKDDWMAGVMWPDSEGNCIRASMVGSIMNDHLSKEGADKTFVMDLLGSPSFLGEFERYTGDKDVRDCVFYSLGACSGLGLDYDSFFICFTPEGAISLADHYQS